MPEFDSDHLKALWEAGVPLSEAWIEFAVLFDGFAHRALRTYPANDPDVLAGDPRYKELSNGWLPLTWEDRRKKLEIITRSERLNLLGEIYDGRLWAIGFRTLPNGFDDPIRVPRRLFFAKDGIDQRMIRPDIDWDIEELRDGENCYFDIRIVSPPVGAGVAPNVFQPEHRSETSLAVPPTSGVQTPAETASTPHTISASKEGRPNRREEIRGKVEELWSTDPLFQEIPHRIDQAREVRARLKGESSRHRDDMPGYRSSSIQRIIGEVANQRPGLE
jgi:hypothetical protein